MKQPHLLYMFNYKQQGESVLEAVKRTAKPGTVSLGDAEMKCQALYAQYFEKGYTVSLFRWSSLGACEEEHSTAASTQFCSPVAVGWAAHSQSHQQLVVAKDYDSSWELLALKGCFGYTPWQPELQ